MIRRQRWIRTGSPFPTSPWLGISVMTTGEVPGKQARLVWINSGTSWWTAWEIQRWSPGTMGFEGPGEVSADLVTGDEADPGEQAAFDDETLDGRALDSDMAANVQIADKFHGRFRCGAVERGELGGGRPGGCSGGGGRRTTVFRSRSPSPASFWLWKSCWIVGLT